MFHETAGGVVVKIRVRPRAGHFSVRADGDAITVSCKSDANRGKANAEVVAGLSRMFGVPVKILSGRSSPRKMIMIPRIDTAAAMKILEASSAKT